MRFLALIMMLTMCDISYGQAVWGNKSYTKPVCSNPNCRMCYTDPNSISNQLAAQQSTFNIQYQQQKNNLALNNVETIQSTTTKAQEYTTIYETQAVTKRVKRCNGRTCWYENVTEYIQVPRQVPLQVQQQAQQQVPNKVFSKNEVVPKSLDKVTELVPTPEDAADIAIRLLSLTSDDTLCEPGCGDGRILAKSTCKSIGIELNPDTAEIARINAPKATIIMGDAAEYDYSNVTAVYMYLYPDLMKKIIPLLKPGTKIVSYCHSIPEIQWEKQTINNHVFYTTTIQNTASQSNEKPEPMLIVNPEITVTMLSDQLTLILK